MPLLTSLLTGIELPFLHRVTRHIPDDGLSDIPRSVRDALNASGVAERLLPNGEVAIGVGSRGIARFATDRPGDSGLVQGARGAAFSCPVHGKPRRGHSRRAAPRCWSIWA